MKKAQRIIILSFCTSLILSACSTKTTSEKAALDTLAVESEMTITSSSTQVSDFIAKNKDFMTYYETDECYNITPVFVAENSEYEVFKYSDLTSHLSCMMVKFTVLAGVLGATA